VTVTEPDGSLTTVFGYCANFAPVPNGDGRKVCWHKPNPESCGRSPVVPLPEDIPLLFTNATEIYPPEVKRPIRWRVASCQNLMPGGCKNPISDENHLYRFGKIRQFE
jgi:hypothetical protein